MIFSENKPIYLQITDKIMDAIVAGEYPAEERLPSVREYAANVEVNANTVMRSYDWLQQQGIIYNRRGIGFFVMQNAVRDILKMRRKIFFKEEAEYFFRRIASFGITPEELADLYREHLIGKSTEK